MKHPDLPSFSQTRAGKTWVLGSCLLLGAGMAAAQSPGGRTAPAVVVAGPGASDAQAPASVDGMPLVLRVGKSTVLRLPEPADRISVGNPGVADIALLKSNELYLLGKSYGTTNVILWRASGRTSVIELTVGIDTGPLESHIRAMWPNEKEIQVSSAAHSIVLSGSVSSTPVVDQVMRLAEAYATQGGGPVSAGSSAGAESAVTSKGGAASARTGGSDGASGGSSSGGSAKVVNLLRVLNPQQVMLEVKVAEINRSFLESIGVDLSGVSSGAVTYDIISRFAGTLISQITNVKSVSSSGGVTTTTSTDLTKVVPGGGVEGAGQFSVTRNGRSIALRAQNGEYLVRLLAEPNIMTLSGQEGSFLAGGSLLVPSTETVDGKSEKSFKEREFGVSLKFTPTVLENGRVHLKVSPEVSELVDRSLDNSSGTVLPQISVRRASSVVQLMDGQSLAIAGLIKSNTSMQANRFPGLGEIPILGALFRSADFANDRTELVFVVTPRLVKPLPENHSLPGDNFVQPTRAEFFLEGRFEGRKDPAASTPAPVSNAAPAPAAPPPAAPAPALAPAPAPAAPATAPAAAAPEAAPAPLAAAPAPVTAAVVQAEPAPSPAAGDEPATDAPPAALAEASGPMAATPAAVTSLGGAITTNIVSASAAAQ